MKMMKKIFGTLQIFPPRHYGTPRDRADLGSPHYYAPREQKNGRENPGHWHLETDG
jgi:hypothetical protein